MADLARIKVSEQEVASLHQDMERILGFVKEIQGADTDSLGDVVVPEHHNVFREDEEPHEPGTYTKAILENAPEVSEDHVKVSKII